MSFSDWLLARDIDIQQLEPDIEAALRRQYEAETSEPDSVLVLPSDCQWPARAYWVAV
jgi:hypothetical protein